MRFIKPLDKILGQKSKIKILRLLSLYKKEPTIREVSRETGITPPNASRILKELKAEGVVTAKKAGRSILYSLNSKHYLVKNVILPIFKKEQRARMDLVRLLKSKLDFPVESIILFGSVARGGEKPGSDLDLLFIIPDKANPKELEEKIYSLSPQLISYFGNSISPLIMKRSEFLLRFKNGERLLRTILKDGEVLAGQLIGEILCQK